MNHATTRLTLPIASTRRESGTVQTLSFAGHLAALPGQFVMLTDFQTGEKPFSLSCVEEQSFSVTLRDVGPLTHRVCRLRVGDLVGIRGAFGSSFFVPSAEKVLLVGGGCGTPPLSFLARRLLENQNTVVFLGGARSRDEILFAPQLAKIGIEYRTTSEDVHPGTVVDLSARTLAAERFDRVYAAGPELMLVALRKLLIPTSLPHQFLLERYMKCGIGICGSCAMDDTGIRLCVEGPVVDDATLADLGEFGAYRRDPSGHKVRFAQ
jgi:dihydroorotate dehydrogenase electron transfer subunit